MRTIEIRPKLGATAFLIGAGCLVFTTSGLWLIFYLGKPADIAVGLLSILFFGGGSIFVFTKLFRRKNSLMLTPEGIIQYFPYGSTFLPWEDIEDIGIFNVGMTEMVGVRLKTREKYLNSVPEAGKNRVGTKLAAGFVSVLGAVTSLGSQSGRASARTVGNAPPPSGTENIVTLLDWNKSHYGYDLAFSWADMDRSAEAFAEMLRSYWNSKEKGPDA